MKELEREDDLEAHLGRRSPLQRTLTEIDRLEPPQELDRIVLSRARTAIEDSESLQLHRSLRSSLSFGLAACLVLVIAIVIATRPHTVPPATSAARAAPLPAAPAAAAPSGAPSLAAADAKTVIVSEQLAPAHAASANLRTSPARDATAWLRDIGELRRQGRSAEAEREWSAFLKAHPEYGKAGHCVPGEPC